MMKYLQKLGKALMLPVAVLPICGILMGLGYALAPGVMGVPGAATSGAAYTVGFLLVKASTPSAWATCPTSGQARPLLTWAGAWVCTCPASSPA